MTTPPRYFHGTTALIEDGAPLHVSDGFVFAATSEQEARLFGGRFLRHGQAKGGEVVHVYEVLLDATTVEPDLEARGDAVRAASGHVVRLVSEHPWEQIRSEVEGPRRLPGD